MFSNLKSKVIREPNKGDLSDQSSVKIDDGVKRAPSIESINSTATSEHRIKKKDETIKKWENKVQNLVSKVREKNSQVEDLEKQINRDKLEYERKINELKESSALNVKQILDDHRNELQKLEQEKEKLQKRVLNAETKAHTLYSQSFNANEEVDNLKDLTMQELAKVKHMLILKEKLNESLQDKMDEQQSKLSTMEMTITKLTKDLSKRTEELSKLNSEREKESEERRSQQTTIRGLLNDKELLEQKLDEHQILIEKKESLLSRVERNSAELHSKLQQVTYDYDQLKQKHSRLEEEKEDRESDLKDRIRSLENHLVMVRESEGVDERVKLLEEKCFQLDSKNREEKELKDKLLKSWSERVYSLESQIANLNKKIAEDSQEIASYNQTKDEIKETYEKQIKSVRQEVIDRDKKLELLQQECDNKVELFSKEKQNQQKVLENLQAEFDEKCTENTDLSKEIFELKKEYVKIQEQMNNVSSELKVKSNISIKLDEDVKKLKMELDEKDEELVALNDERFKRELKVTELNSQVSSLESMKTELEKRIHQIDSEYKSLQAQYKENIDEKEILKKNLESTLEKDQELRTECDQRIKTMKNEVDSRLREVEVAHAEIIGLKDQIRELESEKDTVLIGIESTEVLKLKNQIEILNTQLSEKTSIIRTQKQKIGDLKKTLCKEIKLNNNLSTIQSSHESDLNNSRNSSFNQLPNNQSESASNYIGRSSAIGSSNHSLLLQPPMTNDNVSLSSGDEGPVVVDQNGFVLMDQINFKYLRHVILKFLLSKDSEAYQMIKAISTLLRLTKDDELRIKQNIDSRNSWFKSTHSSSSNKKSAQFQLSPKSSSIGQNPTNSINSINVNKSKSKLRPTI